MNLLRKIKDQLFPEKWYVVFRTLEDCGLPYDEYEVVRGKKLAQTMYANLIKRDNVICAGWSEIKSGTDHWSHP